MLSLAAAGVQADDGRLRQPVRVRESSFWKLAMVSLDHVLRDENEDELVVSLNRLELFKLLPGQPYTLF